MIERVSSLKFKSISTHFRLQLADEREERLARNISLMTKMYLESERQFLEFNNIVPYIGNGDSVYSPRLVTMLQGIGSQIDGMLKIISDIVSIQPERQTFPSYIEALNRSEMLSKQHILLRDNTSELIFPFCMIPDGDNLAWWKAYNDTKHGLPEGAYSGKYGNVINALAALAILHEIAAAAKRWHMYRNLIIDPTCWHSQPLLTGVSMSSFAAEYSGVFHYVMLFAPNRSG